MITVSLTGHKEIVAMLGDIAKQQAPFALSQTINDLLFKGKQAINAAQDRAYEGGSTKWSKSGIGYLKSTKQVLIGMIYLSDNPEHEYLKLGINGGTVHPLNGQKAIKVPSKGQGLNKYGNFSFGGGKTWAGKKIDKANSSKTHFIGIPKNIEKMPFFKGQKEDYYGVWMRQGKAGKGSKTGAYRKVTMQLGFEKTRTQRAYFKNPEQYAVNVVRKEFIPIFNRRIAKAIATAK